MFESSVENNKVVDDQRAVIAAIVKQMQQFQTMFGKDVLALDNEELTLAYYNVINSYHFLLSQSSSQSKYINTAVNNFATTYVAFKQLIYNELSSIDERNAAVTQQNQATNVSNIKTSKQNVLGKMFSWLKQNVSPLVNQLKQLLHKKSYASETIKAINQYIDLPEDEQKNLDDLKNLNQVTLKSPQNQQEIDEINLQIEKDIIRHQAVQWSIAGKESDIRYGDIKAYFPVGQSVSAEDNTPINQLGQSATQGIRIALMSYLIEEKGIDKQSVNALMRLLAQQYLANMSTYIPFVMEMANKLGIPQDEGNVWVTSCKGGHSSSTIIINPDNSLSYTYTTQVTQLLSSDNTLIKAEPEKALGVIQRTSHIRFDENNELKIVVENSAKCNNKKLKGLIKNVEQFQDGQLLKKLTKKTNKQLINCIKSLSKEPEESALNQLKQHFSKALPFLKVIKRKFLVKALRALKDELNAQQCLNELQGSSSYYPNIFRLSLPETVKIDESLKLSLEKVFNPQSSNVNLPY